MPVLFPVGMKIRRTLLVRKVVSVDTGPVGVTKLLWKLWYRPDHSKTASDGLKIQRNVHKLRTYSCLAIMVYNTE